MSFFPRDTGFSSDEKATPRVSLHLRLPRDGSVNGSYPKYPIIRGQYSQVGYIRSHSQQLSVRLLISSFLATSACRSPESNRRLRSCSPKVFGCLATGKLRVQTGDISFLGTCTVRFQKGNIAHSVKHGNGYELIGSSFYVRAAYRPFQKDSAEQNRHEFHIFRP